MTTPVPDDPRADQPVERPTPTQPQQPGTSAGPGGPPTPGHPAVPSPRPVPTAAPPVRPGPTHPAHPSYPGHPGYPGHWPPPPHRSPAPSLLSRRWPASKAGASRTVLGATATAALVGAVSIPLDRPGVGWLIAGLAGATALLGAALAPAEPAPAAETDKPANPIPDPTPGEQTDKPATPTPGGSAGESVPDGAAAAEPRAGRTIRQVPVRLFWGTCTVALLGVGTVRAAGWLFVLCLLTAGVTSCLTVIDARSVRALALAVVLPPVGLVRSVPWVVRGARRTGGAGLGRTAATIAISALLLVVFGALFTSADAAFAGLVDAWLPDLSALTVIRWVFLFVVITAGLLGAGYLLAAPVDLSGLEQPARRRVRRFEWALPVAVLDVLFALFVAVQITVLFGGARHVLGPSGPTYAEYARSGFWQLLTVTALTLLVIAGAVRWAPRDTPGDRTLIRLLLGALVLLSLVVVGSAVHRMNLYTQEYGATRLRLLVVVCELWLGLVFVLILVAGLRLRARWLPQLVLGTAVVALLGLAVANPDRLIAERNVERHAQTGRLDRWYLSQLSADAVPALDRLPAELRSCVLIPIRAELASDRDDWRGTNLGRIQARELIDDWATPGGSPACPPPGRRN